MKVGVVGAGAVGAATVLSLIERGGMCRELVVLDRDRKRAVGVATDMRYATPLSPTVEVRAGDYEALTGAALVIVTAGVNEKTGGATDRADPEGRRRLLDTNAEVYADVVPKIVATAPEAVIMVVTDPPDPLADLTRRLAGHDRVFSTGTLIDSLRFRVHLADRLHVRPRDVQAMVVGEHGTSEVLLWSSASVSGIPVLDLLRHGDQPLDRLKEQIENDIRYANITIIEGTGASQYGIGAVSARLAEAVLRDEGAVLPVAAYSPAYDVTLSLVSVLGAGGVQRMYEPVMTGDERAALERSAGILRDTGRRILADATAQHRRGLVGASDGRQHAARRRQACPGEIDSLRRTHGRRAFGHKSRSCPQGVGVMQVEQVTDPVAYHGEGPVWSARWGGLRWVDMLAGDVLSLNDDGDVGRRHVGSVAAALRPRRGGGAVIAVERGFALEDPDGSLRLLPELWTGNELRMNEGGCDPDGRFYCGSMAYDQRPGTASLYRLDADLTVQVVLEGVTISNGLEWSPDGSRAYYNDTATHRISVFDYDSASGLTGRRTFAEIPDDGRPDGLTVDSEGGVWTAISNGGAVHRYTPDGRLDDVLEVPARKVTACTFGGAQLNELFITTSREGLADGEDPLAGSLFRASPRVVGLPAREFAG